MSCPRSLGPACVVALGAAWFCIGCDDSLKSVSLIEETRVLGARVEVLTDRARSSPRPGERATLKLFVAAPSEPASSSYALSVCAVRPVNSGFPSCAGAPFGTAFQAEPSALVPGFDFELPAELDLAATPHAFASALLCPNAAAELDASGSARCAAQARGIEVGFEFDLGSAERQNHSPNFADDALTLDDQSWPIADASRGCGADLPQIQAGSTHHFGVSFAAQDFEPLMPLTGVEPSRETLLVSEFSSAGSLSHAFLSLSADTPATARQNTWQAPEVSSDSPSLVRFYFVVRDARGGEDFTTRVLCVSR